MCIRDGYQAIPGGSIDLKTLEEISKMTGGKSFMADSENSLKDILKEIQGLEKTEIKSFNQVVYDELFLKFLILGLCLFLFSEGSRRLIIKELA